jgi:hypothetical protein
LVIKKEWPSLEGTRLYRSAVMDGLLGVTDAIDAADPWREGQEFKTLRRYTYVKIKSRVSHFIAKEVRHLEQLLGIPRSLSDYYFPGRGKL